MSDDFFTRLERQLEAAELRELKRAPALRRIVNARRLLAVPLAAAAAAGVVVVVLAVLGAVGSDDAEQPQPAGTRPAPKMEIVANDVERGIRFRLDGRVLTVELLPDVPDASHDAVRGARMSATCNGQTVTQVWPANQTRLRYRFPRDVSTSCRLEDQSGSTIASVSFPAVPPGAREAITQTANNWARLFASTAQPCNEYTSWGRTTCERVYCEGKVSPGGGCKPTAKGWEWATYHRGATVQRIAISGDRAAAMLMSPQGVDVQMVQLRRTATGEWLINKLGPIGAVGSSE
jgi:hypothetical protein